MTVVLDPDGQWVLSYPSSVVNAALYNHAQQVLDDLEVLLSLP